MFLSYMSYVFGKVVVYSVISGSDYIIAATDFIITVGDYRIYKGQTILYDRRRMLVSLHNSDCNKRV